MLKVPFTFSEMIVVVQDMANSRSPVLDGLPFEVDKAPSTWWACLCWRPSMPYLRLVS